MGGGHFWSRGSFWGAYIYGLPPLFVHTVHYRDSCLVLSLSLSHVCSIAPSLALSLCFRAHLSHGIRAEWRPGAPPPLPSGPSSYARPLFSRWRPFFASAPLLLRSPSLSSPCVFCWRPLLGRCVLVAPLLLLTQASLVLFSPPAALCGLPKVLFFALL